MPGQDLASQLQLAAMPGAMSMAQLGGLHMGGPKPSRDAVVANIKEALKLLMHASEELQVCGWSTRGRGGVRTLFAELVNACQSRGLMRTGGWCGVSMSAAGTAASGTLASAHVVSGCAHMNKRGLNLACRCHSFAGLGLWGVAGACSAHSNCASVHRQALRRLCV
jgi:hypothetical protein